MSYDRIKVLNALGLKIRWDILKALCEKDFAIQEELRIMTGKSQGLVASHMGVLMESGLVIGERSGRFTTYRVDKDRIREFIQDLENELTEQEEGYESHAY